MNRRWLCSDVWMDIFPSFDHAQLGLKMALLSDRFDILVDAHFDGNTTELTLWRTIEIRKDKGRNANDNGSKPILSVWISDNDNYLEELPIVPFDENVVKFPSVLIHGNFMEFSMPNRPLHNKIRFHYLYIDYIDHSVLAFLRYNKKIWDRMGTKLTLWPYKTEKDQSIWDVFVREIWPNFATNIRHLGFDDSEALDNLRRRTSPTILTDCEQLYSIFSGPLCPDGIADDGPNATACQALAKWLHTPSKNGQPKRLYRSCSFGQPNPEWVDNFKETFLRATTSVSYQIQLFIHVETTPIEEPLVNERTNEKLTFMEDEDAAFYKDWMLKRCPIGETAPVKWENRENSDANFIYIRFDQRYDNNSGANLNKIIFYLWGGNNCIGPLSPPAEEEKEEDEADQSNGNVV